MDRLLLMNREELEHIYAGLVLLRKQTDVGDPAYFEIVELIKRVGELLR